VEPNVLSTEPTNPTSSNSSTPTLASVTPVTFEQASTNAAARPDDGSCALCSTRMPTGTASFANGQMVCAACMVQVREELGAQSPRASSMLPAAGLGFVGAFIGAAVWAAIAIGGNVEVGYVAVLVGFLAGQGVKLGAGRARSQALQILASATAVVGLLASKYFIFAYVVMDKFDVSPVSGKVASVFFENLGEMLSPFDMLWLALAIGAAYRVPAPTKLVIAAR